MSQLSKWAFQLNTKPVSGHSNWLRQNIQQWAYQAGLVRVGIPVDYLIQERFFGLVAMMPLTIRASLSSMKD